MSYSHSSSVKPSVPSLSEHIHRSGEVKIGSIKEISAHSFIARVIPPRTAMKAYHVCKKGSGGRECTLSC